MYIISDDLISQFMKVAVGNISIEDGLHLETLAFLLGYSENDNFIATDLIFPKQHGQAHKVDDKGIVPFDSKCQILKICCSFSQIDSKMFLFQQVLKMKTPLLGPSRH